jgi:hypothetical protein
MFPSVKTRFASAARRGFDLAVEFATLGEYALVPAAQPREAAPGAHAIPAARAVGVRPRPSRVKPATPAARRLQPAWQERRISARTAVFAPAFDGSAPGSPQRAGRKRAGAPTPRPQHCLVAEAGGRQP